MSEQPDLESLLAERNNSTWWERRFNVTDKGRARFAELGMAVKDFNQTTRNERIF